MDIDEFLDKEASNLSGSSQVVNKSSGGGKGPQDNENLLDQLETAKGQLRQNNITSALKEFEYLKSRYTDMTKKQLSENRYIFNELIKINQEIITKIDAQRSEFEKRKQTAKKLLNDGHWRFNNGELETAYKIYIELNEIIKNTPDLFHEEKNSLSYEATAFASILFPKMQERSNALFEKQKDIILQEIDKAYNQLQQNNGELPKETYDNINKQFNKLPEGHIYEKTILHNDILKLFKSSFLSGETTSLVNQMLKQQQGFANSVLGKGHKAPEALNPQTAQKQENNLQTEKPQAKEESKETTKEKIKPIDNKPEAKGFFNKIVNKKSEAVDTNNTQNSQQASPQTSKTTNTKQHIPSMNDNNDKTQQEQN
ncbi:MAG: hypothetical protein ACQESF_04685, partial [Nanobdellota archaeon]